MLTRKHPHARDLLRRYRREFIFKPTTPSSILAEIMEGRRVGHFGSPGTPAPSTMNRQAWRNLLGWCRVLAEVREPEASSVAV